MNILEYFNSGSWCMWLIAIAGLILYTLLIERFLSLRVWRHNAVRDHQQDFLLQVQRSEHILLIRALIAALPLLGLLGTVSGMMDCFADMRDGHAEIGTGISQALVTTQYALVLAAPALLIERFLSYCIDEDTRQRRIAELEVV